MLYFCIHGFSSCKCRLLVVAYGQILNSLSHQPRSQGPLSHHRGRVGEDPGNEVVIALVVASSWIQGYANQMTLSLEPAATGNAATTCAAGTTGPMGGSAVPSYGLLSFSL